MAMLNNQMVDVAIVCLFFLLGGFNPSEKYELVSWELLFPYIMEK